MSREKLKPGDVVVWVSDEEVGIIGANDTFREKIGNGPFVCEGIREDGLVFLNVGGSVYGWRLRRDDFLTAARRATHGT